MFAAVRRAVESRALTVLVTHWWEYFRDGRPDEEFISVLHEVAGWLPSYAVEWWDVTRKDARIQSCWRRSPLAASKTFPSVERFSKSARVISRETLLSMSKTVDCSAAKSAS